MSIWISTGIKINRPELNLPESLQLYLDTRFEQLKDATDLEIWQVSVLIFLSFSFALYNFLWCIEYDVQESFRSIEDIHGLMCMVKKTPKPQMMAISYSKLTNIFWISKSHLDHAHAWYNLYILHKSYNKKLAHNYLQLMASCVLLATISIMPYDYKHGDHHFEL